MHVHNIPSWTLKMIERRQEWEAVFRTAMRCKMWKHNGSVGLSQRKVIPLSRSAKLSDTMSRLGLRFPQSPSTVSAFWSTLLLRGHERPNICPKSISLWWSHRFYPREREKETAALYYSGIIVARFIGRISLEIGKPQIYFGYCVAVVAFLSSTFG